MKLRFSLLSFLLFLPLVPAQSPERVHWTASALAGSRPGEAVVTVHAVIDKGWHVYAQNQAPGGPTPLLVRVEEGSAYTLSGTVTATPPIRHYDASFSLDTEFYTDSFLLHVPVRASGRGSGDVPVAVRFQLCSETTCMPPKTVHLQAKANAA